MVKSQIMNGKVYLSVVIPCYNEKENLKRGVLFEIKEYLDKQTFNWEVIISDDGSKDGSADLIESQIKAFSGFRFIKNSHGGKPFAIWHGIKESVGKYILFTDMDQSTPIVELSKLIPFVKKDCDAVIGSRGLIRKNFPMVRKMGSMIFVGLRKAFILPEISDTQCGFKVFKREVLLKTFPRLEFFKKEKKREGWNVTSYDVELLHIIKKMGFCISEVNVLWEDKDISESKGGYMRRYLKESWEMLGQILRVKLNDLKGEYNF
ncbi:hypothetical protein A3A50_00100 [Candidatus Woesebacteria bacterium RIFCSPLOWO2_01_FULL_38_20]|nr:MAG: hypothetical protein A3A50_00100 [Candidatus Woesebacteria bacterium RIFCSPLOWO2_01_FULL_38_20]